MKRARGAGEEGPERRRRDAAAGAATPDAQTDRSDTIETAAASRRARYDSVDQASDASFPASDPPSWWSGH